MMLHRYAWDEPDPSPKSPEEVDYFKHRSKARKIDPAVIEKVKKVKMGKIDDIVVYVVDDERVRNTIDIDFVMAGNFARYPYIPLGEIWISQLLKPSDYAPTLVHEWIEARLMSKHNIEYSNAHDFANVFESRFRRRIVAKEVKIKTPADALKQANKIIKEFLSDAIA